MLLELRSFLVKERVGLLKLADTYDIFDPATGRQVGIALEKPGTLITVLRFLISKHMLPTRIDICETESGPPQISIKRGFSLLRPTIDVLDARGRRIGHFKRKLLSLGGAFFVHDAVGSQIAEIAGDWKGWNFTMVGAGGRTLGTVTKKWAGIGKELFTSADNYMIALEQGSMVNAGLLLAAGLAIDIVFKERD